MAVRTIKVKPRIPAAYEGYANVFDKKAADQLPPHRPFDHEIPLLEGKHPSAGPLYSLAPNERQVLKDYIDSNLEKGFIRYSSSSCSAPVLFVKKKDGSLRLCVDYRNLNSITVKNKYPLPLINDLLDRLSHAKVFSKIDLRGAYNLLRIKEGEEWKTAFRTFMGMFEYLVMPFGLTNAPASFQHLMNYIFRMLEGRNFVIVFLDDILIFSSDPREHEGHVREVLEKLQENKLYAKLSKCEFSTQSTEFLGYMVSPKGIGMSPDKAQAIREWPEPMNLKDLRLFLGFVNFYRRFIKDFSEVALPLHKLTRKDKEYTFGDPERAAFKKLQSIVASDQVLRHYDPGHHCIVETDALDFALGAVLSQRDTEGVVRPVAFASRKMEPAELNYPIHKKELLAIVAAFKVWRHYLEGAEGVVQVFTDHKSLEYFMITKQLTRRQARWAELLAEFNMKIEYRSGEEAVKPDTLSRRSNYRPRDLETTSLSAELNPHNYRAVIVARLLTRPADITSWSREPELEELCSLYAEDGEYAQLVFHAREDKESALFLENGILRCRDAMYIPKEMRTRILWLCHDDKTAGHPGRARMLDRLTPRFWWPKMKHDIEEYVDSCIECQQNKPSRQKPLGLLKPLQVPERPWQHVSADFIVQLPPSNGFDAILVIVD
jgi:hypothetical protein